MHTIPRATVQDLYQVSDHGKAEIVNAELVRMSPTGGKPGRAGLEIAFSLRMHEEQHGGGWAIPDNVGFVVDLPDRESFSPDAAWYTGEADDMDFLPGAPVFAVEVRSKNDYGPRQNAPSRKNQGLLCRWNPGGLGCRSAWRGHHQGLSPGQS